jgi:hypothetical protein
MTTMQDLLNKRLDFASSSKVKALAKQSSEGALSSFAGLFGTRSLSEPEEQILHKILEKFDQEAQISLDQRAQDFQLLALITSEVKAITHQAALLHGERIVKAQNVLKKYAEGAFSAWLVASYGNRQTPYNLLCYYQFYHSIPEEMRAKIEAMPRQAIYVLASREAPLEKKQEVVRAYSGQTKGEMLELIRTQFPLAHKDKRKTQWGKNIYMALEKVYSQTKAVLSDLHAQEKNEISALLQKIMQLVDN